MRVRKTTVQLDVPYFTLLVRERGKWFVDFGSWDHEDVDAEIEDRRDHGVSRKDLKVITTDGSQEEIDKLVDMANLTSLLTMAAKGTA
jgi:hypothetical protein